MQINEQISTNGSREKLGTNGKSDKQANRLTDGKNFIGPHLKAPKRRAGYRSSRSQMFFKIVVLKNSQYSQENTSTAISF